MDDDELQRLLDEMGVVLPDIPDAREDDTLGSRIADLDDDWGDW